MSQPSDDFVRMIAKHITEGSVTKAVVEQIRSVIPKALDAMLKERIQDKLNIAFRPEAPAVQEAAPAQGGDDKSEVVTTQDELQAFYIVRAIGAKILPVDRIVMRDAKSYFISILNLESPLGYSIAKRLKQSLRSTT
jgi:predicted type IV restriction endonuclease